MNSSSPATLESHARLLAAQPVLTRIAPLRACVENLPERTLLHAGPPFADQADLPQPVFNSIAAAALHEGWAASIGTTSAALASGQIKLAPAQDFGVVTPLAFVVGPSMFCLEVRDANGNTPSKFSPLNDGPLPDALRMGTGRAAGLEILRRLTGEIGADLTRSLNAPIPLLPVLNRALMNGDDLHGRVEAAQSEAAGFFGDGLSPASSAYLKQANQFVLNVIMAASALMIGAGAGVPGSTVVVASGGNGREHGYKLASDPARWLTLPASRPQGPHMTGCEQHSPLPAIGDSAVIDAAGFGAACLRRTPALADPLKSFVDPAFLSEAAHDAFIGPHPDLPSDIRLGLDLTRPRACLGIMLGMLDETGKAGLIGRGIAPWPSG
jgi:hypothetical protein